MRMLIRVPRRNISVGVVEVRSSVVNLNSVYE